MNKILIKIAFLAIFGSVVGNPEIQVSSFKTIDKNLINKSLNENEARIQEAIFNNPGEIEKIKALSINSNPYSKTQAKVRVGELYNEGERVFIAKRAQKVKQELELLGIKVNHVPVISACFSGGGYRAMISTAGFFTGLEKTGLSKLLSYASALSGSTWTLAPWTCKNCSLSDFKTNLQKRVELGLGVIQNPVQLKQFTDALIDKLINLQPITPVDIYGGLLADKLLNSFDPDRHAVRLSQSAHFVMTGERLMPIYTSIICNEEVYHWMEHTPFETGCSYLKSYVPTWAFGRKFSKGISKDYAPEQSLGYLMGIWGSAFEIAVKDLIQSESDKIKQSSLFLYSILDHIDDTAVGDMRLAPATVFNFSKGIPASPLKDEKYISMVDAGLHFNLPLPPLLERKSDIIIIFDASAGNVGGMEFKKAYKWAIENGYKMPKFDLNDNTIEKKNITILKDADPSLPIIIYMPLTNETGAYKNGYLWDKQDYTSTFNFKYKKEQFDDLAGLPEFNLTNAADKILDVIKEVAGRTN